MILRYWKGWMTQRTPAPTCFSGPRSEDVEFATVMLFDSIDARRLRHHVRPVRSQSRRRRSKGVRNERIPGRLTRA
jgi:hypothetical protein